MRVEELEDLLARLPGDMLVAVEAGRTACHVTVADKRNSQRVTWFADPESGLRVPILPGEGPFDRLPPMLILRGTGGVGWWRAEPRWRVNGRWPKAEGLPR